MENLVSWMGATIVSAFIGSYLSAYMKKKGENLATHEDIQKLVEQVQATTEATKAIEARISDDLWGRQRRWEIKRDTVFGMLKAIGQMNAALLVLDAANRASGRDSETTKKRIGAFSDFQTGLHELDNHFLLCRLSCGPSLSESLAKVRETFLRLYSVLERGFSGEFSKEEHVAASDAVLALMKVAKEEVGLE